jgi:hypothetical protein
MHAACIASVGTRPKREFAGGGASARKVTYEITQPSCEAERHSDMLWNEPPTSFPLGTAMFVPSSSAERILDWMGLPSISFDLVLDQLSQHARALRVSDEYDAAALVVVLEIVVPGREHVVIAELAIRREAAAGHCGAQRFQRDLSIERCVQLALSAEASELCAHDAVLFRPRLHVAVRRGIVRDRRIHVETIDGCVRIGFERFVAEFAIRRDDRRREIDSARVLATRAAQPGCRLAVVIRD